MQIVIDISEDTYKRHKWRVNSDMCTELDIAVAKGVVLPEKHGRLKDEEELLNAFWTYCHDGDFGYHQAEDLIKSNPTILEAWGNEE